MTDERSPLRHRQADDSPLDADEHPERSDQLPEEGPAPQVVDDTDDRTRRPDRD